MYIIDKKDLVFFFYVGVVGTECLMGECWLLSERVCVRVRRERDSAGTGLPCRKNNKTLYAQERERVTR